MRAFLVLGAEGTGTRLMTRLLIAAGCSGDGQHEQRWDTETPTDPLVVWRRSFPHNGVWPDLSDMYASLHDYAVRTIVMVRDWYTCSRAQVATHPYVPTEEVSLINLQRAYLEIFRAIELPFIVVSYESIVAHPEAITEILRILGLPTPQAPENIVDGNAKYFS